MNRLSPWLWSKKSTQYSPTERIERSWFRPYPSQHNKRRRSGQSRVKPASEWGPSGRALAGIGRVGLSHSSGKSPNPAKRRACTPIPALITGRGAPRHGSTETCEQQLLCCCSFFSARSLPTQPAAAEAERNAPGIRECYIGAEEVTWNDAPRGGIWQASRIRKSNPPKALEPRRRSLKLFAASILTPLSRP